VGFFLNYCKHQAAISAFLDMRQLLYNNFKGNAEADMAGYAATSIEYPRQMNRKYTADKKGK
jgi:hypothetical protein